MNIFDIIGPIMVGPSSSHTAGSARLGYTTKEILGEAPIKAVIHFHGSLAETYKGHGSDKAVIGGLLGFKTDDVRIKNSLELAGENNLEFEFKKIEIDGAHPNTMVIEAFGKSGRKLTLEGASVGGGNIIIQRLNGIKVDFNGAFDTLIIEHTDAPGVISHVTSLLAARKINVASMKVFRSQKGGQAIMIIESDGNLDKKVADVIEDFDFIISTRYIKKFD